MSIFTETFKDYVTQQLKIRESIIEGSHKSRFGNPKIEFEYPTINGPVLKKLSIPPGAFFTNTTSKQCVIRMSSGVDLKNPKLLENYGFENPNDLLGSGLAIRYMLEGGIPSKNIDFNPTQTKFTGGDPMQIKTIPRGRSTRGFASGYGSTYGDPYIRSDAQDGFGIVPMPGIIDANIRTKTAYGSLRESQIKFTCHNRRQLEILELLYMRPGFPILLEWGWSPFINNDGEIIENFPYQRKWFSKNSNINQINKDILSQKIQHSGNYDGFVGFVKNFEISARADGGYDCTTELTAMGEILEGIKGKRTGKTIETESPDQPKDVDDFEFYLAAINEFSEAYTAKYSSEIARKALNKPINPFDHEVDVLFPKRAELLESYQELAFLIDKKKPEFQPTQDELDKIQAGEVSERTTNVSDIPFETTFGEESENGRILPQRTGSALTDEGVEYQDEIERIEKTLDQYIIRKGEALIVNGTDEKDVFEEKKPGWISGENPTGNFIKSQYTYIRFDFLANILNNFIIPLYQESTINHPIVEIIQDPKYKYSIYKLNERYNNERVDIGGDSFQTTLGESIQENSPYDNNLGDYMDISSNPEICLLPHQMRKQDQGTNSGRVSEKERSISKVFFNMDHVLKIYQGLLYNEDGGINEGFGIYSFLERIWKDASKACSGTHEFILQTDEPNRPNTVRVIDMIYQNEKLDNVNKLHEIKIQGNKSIVRDFSYSTTIDSKFASTIAIAAQSPNSVDSLDALTFKAFNKDIEYRFYKPKDTDTSDKQDKRLSEKYDRDLSEILNSVEKIRDHRQNIISGLYTQNQVTLNISRVKNLEKKLISLTSRYGYTNPTDEFIKKGAVKNHKDTNLSDLSKSAVVPLNFGCTMDGISGIVIGNIFKVEKSKLPKGYQGDDVAFVIFTENQTITAGQDWITELSGQMILLDIPPNEITPAGTVQSDNGETENPTDNAIKEEEKKFPRRQIIVTNSNNQITIQSKYYDSETTNEFLINGIQEQILEDKAQSAYNEENNLPSLPQTTYGDYSGDADPLLTDDEGNKYYIIDTIELFHPEAYAEDLETGWGYYLERRGSDKRIIIKDYPSFSVLYEGQYMTEITRLDGRSIEEVLVEEARKLLKESLGMIQQ